MAVDPQRTEPNVEELLALARDRSTAARNRLVEILSELFDGGVSALPPGERDLMTQILERLIHDVEMSVRKALAEKLAADDRAPRSLINMLANDEVPVAQPILSRSKALHDLDLVEIVRHRTLGHRLAVAMREKLSPVVCNALLENREMDVVMRVIENPGADIAPAMVDQLVDESKEVSAYRGPLLHRHDLDPKLARRMYWWVSAALRKHIVDNFHIDPAELDVKIEHTIKQILNEPRGNPISVEQAKALAQKLGASGSVTPQLLVQALRRGEVELFVALFAEHSGLRPVLIRRFILEAGGEGLAIACKALDVEKSDFVSLFVLSRQARPGEKAVDPTELASTVSLYDRINIDTAAKVLSRWKLDPDYLYALKQVEGGEAAAESKPTKAHNPKSRLSVAN
jgi:uncharacterized protein (DUF2336 family)